MILHVCATKVVVPGTMYRYILRYMQRSFVQIFISAVLVGSTVTVYPINGQQLISVADRSLVAVPVNNSARPPTRADRVSLAEALKANLLEHGRDIQVRAKGRGAKILVVKSALIDEPFVFNFSDDGRLIKKLQVAGFMSIHFDNGSQIWDQQMN
jgi:hypothetical protein